MSSRYVPPIVSVAYNFDEDRHVLMVSNHGYSAEAGIRVFRAEPWPDIKFKHETSEAAEKDAAMLRAYLDECCSGGRKETGEATPRARGWWED